MRLKNKIRKLTSKVRKLLPSNLNDEQIPPVASEDVHSQSIYSDDVQQPPTGSEAGTGIVPIFEYNTPATVTNPEGSPRLRRTDRIGAPLPSRRILSRNWSDGRLILADVDEVAVIPTSSKLDNGIVPISGDNTPAAATNPEGSPRFRRTDLIGAELPPWRILSRNWSNGQLILQGVDEDAMISDEIWGETGDCLEEKSVMVVSKDMQENQMGYSSSKNSIEYQSSSPAQHVHSYARQKDITTTREDPLTSPNQLASFATKQREAQSKAVTDNAISAEDQSTSPDELTSPCELSLSNAVAETYQYLSFSSKCCLLYLGMFPRFPEIPIRRLLQLWLAERLVAQPAGETRPLEDLAKNCFDELVRTNMVEIAEKRLDGNPKTCRVTSTVYDSLLVNAEKVGFFHIHRSSGTAQPPQSNIRRLAEHLMYINTNPADISIRHMRSYISLYPSRGAPTTGVSMLLNKIIEGGFGILVVLDLEGVFRPVLPKMLGKLRQLKYLGLRRTYLDSIPESVGGLPLLETLDIKHTGIITLPSTIWVAKKLRNLYMSEICADVSTLKISAHGTLSNLQILWGLLIGREIPETDWLDSLTGLRELKLTCLEASMEAIAGWLSKLSNLQCLKLTSLSDSKEPALLALGEMKMLANLSRLYLLGQLPQSLKVSELPENLEVLTLAVSHLSEDPMEAIGKLGKLKGLRLYAHSFKGQNMTCHKDGFPNLQVLKLWMLVELQNWTVEENAMPVLKELEIRCCKKLENVDGLEKLTSLKEFTLTNMEPQFVADAEKKVGSQVKIQKNNWKFSSPWDMVTKVEAAP